ncbi:hypothetical protein EVAR_3394_1 [Eumeta japonica]|uniref:Histone-lysine N-methyltransferase SETMAR n=1 Tax=Eumeta variegata TaxID=151549 RepID=A0A4C1SV02_EUMVA|nr:hypothetical protein EVAR_3394_1 [Eumeta japonica]
MRLFSNYYLSATVCRLTRRGLATLLVKDEGRSGRPPTAITQKNVRGTEKLIRENQRFTNVEIERELGMDQQQCKQLCTINFLSVRFVRDGCPINLPMSRRTAERLVSICDREI